MAGDIATNSPSVFVSVQYLLKIHALRANKKAILNQTDFTTVFELLNLLIHRYKCLYHKMFDFLFLWFVSVVVNSLLIRALAERDAAVTVQNVLVSLHSRLRKKAQE